MLMNLKRGTTNGITISSRDINKLFQTAKFRNNLVFPNFNFG